MGFWTFANRQSNVITCWQKPSAINASKNHWDCMCRGAMHTHGLLVMLLPVSHTEKRLRTDCSIKPIVYVSRCVAGEDATSRNRLTWNGRPNARWSCKSAWPFDCVRMAGCGTVNTMPKSKTIGCTTMVISYFRCVRLFVPVYGFDSGACSLQSMVLTAHLFTFRLFCRVTANVSGIRAYSKRCSSWSLRAMSRRARSSSAAARALWRSYETHGLAMSSKLLPTTPLSSSVSWI